MQTYTAELECYSPVANGFHCGTEDSTTFSYAGGIVNIADAAVKVLNDTSKVTKRCWKCFSQNWKIKRFTPISYRASAEVTRG